MTTTRAGIGPEVRQDVLAHLVRHGDHAVRGFHRGLLDPRRHEVAAAELIGLPGAQRLHAVQRDDERDAVERADPERAHVRVPRVGVHDVGVHLVARHGQADRERLQRGHEARAVLAAHALPRRVAAQGDAVVARLAGAEAADLDGHAAGQGLAELIGDDAGAAVDVGRVFAGDEQSLHDVRIARERSGLSGSVGVVGLVLTLELARHGTDVDA